MTPASPSFVSESGFRVRSYELDGLGHVNHAVYLNYLEQARFDALAAGGFPPRWMEVHGWAVHVVRIEVDYRLECRFGDALVARTWVEEFRKSSMVLRQEIHRLRDGGTDTPPGRGDLAVEARIVAVWIGTDGRPMRIPEEAREALGR